MKNIVMILLLFVSKVSFGQVVAPSINNDDQLKACGKNLIWMTLVPGEALEHFKATIIYPTLSEFRIASQDFKISEKIRRVFQNISEDEISYLLPYSALMLEIADAQRKIFTNPNNPSENEKIMGALVNNLKSNKYVFKIDNTMEKNYINENNLSDKVVSCEITIPVNGEKKFVFSYFCYKYGSNYKLGIPGKGFNWYFFLIH